MENPFKTLINVEELSKGQVLSVDQLERLLAPLRAGTQAFDLAVLKLRTYIEREKAAAGEIVTVRHVNGGLRLLTDGEASVYNHARFCRNLKQLWLFHGRAAGVEVSEFDEEQRARHDRQLCQQGAMLLAVRTVNEQQRLLPRVVGEPKQLEE